MTEINVAFAQTNPVVGDVQHNLALILEAAESVADTADILITGELALSGYPMGDLSYRADVIDATLSALDQLVAASTQEMFSSLYFVVGHISFATDARPTAQSSLAIAHNSASVIQNGTIIGTYNKQILPNYDVFDDWRNFIPGNNELVFSVSGKKCAVAICEDIWDANSSRPQKLNELGIDLLLVLNGSPYTRKKAAERQVAARSFQRGFDLAYSNLCGAQDELVFDGGSFLLNSSGTTLFKAPFERGCFLALPNSQSSFVEDELSTLWMALVEGLKQYCQKTGQHSIVLGLSGGIDSAVCAALACDAMGASNVIGVALPSRYSSDHSLSDAAELAHNLGIQYRITPIDQVHQAFEQTMDFSALAAENLQARIRAVLLMGISNTDGALLLSTGNKSEIAVGYSTMYGDAAGGFAPIKDVLKTDVWRLAKWFNSSRGSALIPVGSIEKPPSAELRPGQVDSDSLPDYELLDQILTLLIEHSATIEEVVANGFQLKDVVKIEAMIRASEWKRSQGAIGTKTTAVSFGTGRRIPLTTKFRKL
ncbi:MAG: NAD+ synthase [Aquiluna sp.]|nr:NAD+ synthase [Aquiluna sp.]